MHTRTCSHARPPSLARRYRQICIFHRCTACTHHPAPTCHQHRMCARATLRGSSPTAISQRHCTLGGTRCRTLPSAHKYLVWRLRGSCLRRNRREGFRSEVQSGWIRIRMHNQARLQSLARKYRYTCTCHRSTGCICRPAKTLRRCRFAWPKMRGSSQTALSQRLRKLEHTCFHSVHSPHMCLPSSSSGSASRQNRTCVWYYTWGQCSLARRCSNAHPRR